MRNLKKILALVLSLVMTFSVMSVASAAFKDAESVNGAYTDAVDVLSYLGVFNGYEDGTFKPQGDITRAEVAAIIYRIDTGDVKDVHTSIYSDYNRFEDVKSTSWYAGYVNYCANAEFVKGRGENTFDPNGKVTGYEVLAMILRVVGYDQNNEFSGSEWKIQVASTAQQLGITRNVNSTTLNAAATRELVAELLWRTVYEVPQVTYNMLMQGYNKYQDAVPNANSKLNNTINQDNWQITEFEGNDAWGRPGYGYTIYTGTTYADTIVFYADAPDAVYTEAVDQCTIVKETGLKGTVAHYINGVPGTNYVDSQHKTYNHIEGAQGTVVEVYKAAKTIVEIDTYLAQVTFVQKTVTDKNGHIVTHPYDWFTIHGLGVANYDGSVYGNNFTKGEYYLVNYNEYYGYVEPYAVAESVDAKQTKIWWNAEKHTIAGTDYMDNVNYTLDDAGFDKDNAYTWFFDSYNNVIGSAKIVVPATPANYAVVLGAQWINGVGEYGYAQATVQYMTGEVVTEKVAAINGVATSYADADTVNFNEGRISTVYQYNKNTTLHLYQIVKNANGTVSLYEVEKELANTIGADGKPAVDANGDQDHVCIVDGRSQIEDTNVYTDNNTLYVYWDLNDAKTAYELKFVTGYDNLPKTFHGRYVDVVEGDYFANIVYIPVEVTHGVETKTAEKYVYITNKSYADVLGNCFVINGVIDAEGNTEALKFPLVSAKYGMTEQATANALEMLVSMYKDALVKVTYNTTTGLVEDVEGIGEGATTAKNGKATFAGVGEYLFIGTGVVKFVGGHNEAGLALNVNGKTVIINQDGQGVKVDDLNELYGNNLYVVYSGTQAVAIFVTSDDSAYDYANVLNYVVTGAANDSELTYVVGSDVEAFEAALADVVDAALNNSFATYLFEIVTGEAVNVVDVAFAGYDEFWADFYVTISCDGYNHTVLVWVPAIAFAE